VFGDSPDPVPAGGDDEVVRPAVLHGSRAASPEPEVRVGVEETLILPADDDEQGWIKWAHIALKYEGVDQALEVLGCYLALNPERADVLAEEWSNRESSRDREPGLA